MTTTAAMTQEECVGWLARITGENYTRVDGELIAVAPADAAVVADILRFANVHGIPVMPAGSGTKLHWGNPVEAGIRLDLRRMTAPREHAWQDMTCTVEAGCSWDALQRKLAERGQMVALDPLWPERATVGGVVATNDSGVLRLKYGGLRDLIIGMIVVLADGTIAKTGGKVVKNVAGYDLHKLMTGSMGTLGVIVEVNFRLHPVEANARVWTAIAGDAMQFETPLRALLDAQMTPTSVQIRASRNECTLDVRIAATPECLDEHAVSLQKMFGQMELKETDTAVWRARQHLHESANAALLKLSMLPSEICSVTDELRQWESANTAELSVVAQATGLMTVMAKAAPDAAIALIEHLRAKLKSSGGSVVVQQLPEELRRRVDVWGCDSNSLPLMREIKRRFDPNRILNPGRFVGNI